jgi:hypothetical protein
MFYIFELRKRDIDTGELILMFFCSIIPLVNVTIGLAFFVNFVVMSIIGLVKK